MKQKRGENIIFRNLLLLVALALWISAAFFAYYVLSSGGHLYPRAADKEAVGTLVKGKVLSSASNAVMGAKIIIFAGDSRRVYISGEAGDFAIVNLLEGNYKVRVSKEDYLDVDSEIFVTKEVVSKNFVLSHEIK